MAEFTGTVKEFNKFIGPRVRNVVQRITSKKRKEQAGICQMCGARAKLDAAHKKGMSRIDIIEKKLEKYSMDGQKIKVDLEIIDKEIIKAHTPIDKYFLFLCPACHRKYDYKPKVPKAPVAVSKKVNAEKARVIGQDMNPMTRGTLDRVKIYCKNKGLSEGTTYSAISLVRHLMNEYGELPEPARVAEDMGKRGASKKSIGNTLWALKIWATVSDS